MWRSNGPGRSSFNFAKRPRHGPSPRKGVHMLTEHPARWAIAILVIFIACRSGLYLRALRHAIRTLEAAEHRDDMGLFAARRRYRLIRWLLGAQACFVLWAAVIITVDTAITWRTVVAFAGVFGGQLFVAWGIKASAQSDAEFLDRFADSAAFFCTDQACPYRLERERHTKGAP